MKTTLVIMAAGMASRYGSMKQIQQFGPGGETIMDYSIYDAIKAGFNKVVFIIRKDFAEDFKNIFEPKLKDRIENEYVYQELDAFLGSRTVPADRKKPWGTAHAILCANEVIREPFAVINADDYYGADAFVKAQRFLVMEAKPDLHAIIAYRLANTLSEHGSVSRGVTDVDAEHNLVSINERLKLYRENGVMVYEETDGSKHPVPEDALSSMNFWCFSPEIMPYLRSEFENFLSLNYGEPKAEFLIPRVADEYIHTGKGKIKVIPTDARWFGVTYKEHAPVVERSVNEMVAAGEYPVSLWT